MINKTDIETIGKIIDIIKVIDKNEIETIIDRIEIKMIGKKRKNKITEVEIDRNMISNLNKKLNK